MLAAGWNTICEQSFQRGLGVGRCAEGAALSKLLAHHGDCKRKARACILTAESFSASSFWQECCELMDEARWEQAKGWCVRDRDWELWSDSGQCVKKRDGAIGYLLFSRHFSKINMDSLIWCSLGLRCLAQVQNGLVVHELFHLWFEPTVFGFPAQTFNHYDSTIPDNGKHQKIAGSRSKIIISFSKTNNPWLLWIKMSVTRLLI